MSCLRFACLIPSFRSVVRTVVAAGLVSLAACSGNSDGGGQGADASTSSNCRGTATECSALLSALSCAAAEGCSRNESCAGVPKQCSSLDLSTCLDVDGCSWDSSARKCTGSPRACSLVIKDESRCKQQGCTWTFDCHGTASKCAEVSDSYCSTQPGCHL